MSTTSLDTLVSDINRHINTSNRVGIGNISLRAYIKGTSECTQRKRITRFLPSVLPFNASEDKAAFESLCQITYQYPYKLTFTPLAIRSNTSKGKRIMNEVFQVLMPIYNIERKHIGDGNKYYVLPFSNDGLSQYNFTIQDTLLIDHEPFYVIGFVPKTPHHSLISGSITLSAITFDAHNLTFSGRIDFGEFTTSIDFSLFNNYIIPSHSTIRINYNYGGSLGYNDYECFFFFNKIQTLDSLKNQPPQYDLTDIYRTNPLETFDFDTIRPEPLSPAIDSLLQQNLSLNTGSRPKRKLYETIPERLVTTSNINAFGTNIKVYGPFAPTSFGYDHLNGITLRQRLRWSHLYTNGQSILLRPEIGYSFGLNEWRYRLSGEWTYNPKRRMGLRMELQKRNSGFSSKFIDVINQALDSTHVNFNQLGLNYYDHYLARLEHSFELYPGFMAYIGATYNHRRPVRHGSRAIPPDQLNQLVKKQYSDFTPYIRLEWTPAQYYYYQGKQKLYIDSYWPTIELEMAHATKGLWNTTSDYGRIELDIHQTIRISPQRSLIYRIGGGSFLKQQGEYFINYSYFSRGQYPDDWNDRIGGRFNLLEDYWYNSSPSYIQTHLMYVSPFLLLHKAPLISKYVIRERIYLSSLWAEGKNAYTEIGYGMGNNYFNIGAFCGFTGFQFMDFGFKASIAIDQHW